MKKPNAYQPDLFPDSMPKPAQIKKRKRNRGAGRVFHIMSGPHAGEDAIYILDEQTDEIRKTGKILLHFASGPILIEKGIKVRTVGFID